MKYINREYGIASRPPFVKNFSEESSTGGKVGADCYPQRPITAVGSVPEIPNGAVIAGSLGTVWLIKYCVFKNGRWLDSDDFMSWDYTACDAGGRFRYVMAASTAVSFVKYDRSSVVLSLSALEKVRVRIEFAALTGGAKDMKLQMNTLFASAPEHAVIKGECKVEENFVVHTSRSEVEFAADGREEYASATFYGSALNGSYDLKSDRACYEIELNTENSRLIAFMRVGDEQSVKEIPSEEELNRGVGNAELEYSASKPAGTGELAAQIADVTSLVYSHRVYDRLSMSVKFKESRAFADVNLTDEPTLAAAGVIAAAKAGTPDAESAVKLASEPVLGALAVWTTYVLSRDKSMLEKAYPKIGSVFGDDLKLVVSGADRREIAYKLTGSPLKELGAEPVYALEFSTYKLLALEIKAMAAKALGYERDYNGLTEKIAAYTVAFNDCFYDGRLGLYMDRYVSGGFTGVYGATSFLPLITSAVNSNDVLDALLTNLTDEKKFFTRAPVPTLSADHPAYGKAVFDKLTYIAPYSGYTGSAVPYLDYMIYSGLVRQGAEKCAEMLSGRLAELNKEYFLRYASIPDRLLPNYKLDSSGNRDSLSGTLIGLAGASGVLDAEYFGTDLRPAISFGVLSGGRHSVSGIKMFGRTLSVSVTPDSATLIVNGKKVFEAVGGGVKVRRFAERKNGMDFYITSPKSLTLTLSYPVFTSEKAAGRVLRFNLAAGKHRVSVSGKDFIAEKI